MRSADSNRSLRPPLVALVTGANRGIGLEICRQLAAQGLRVILTGRDAGRARKAASELASGGLDVTAAVLDVDDAKSIRALAERVRTRFGGVDVLVNNAAILNSEDRDVLDTAVDDLRATFETNVIGALAVCQTFVPDMVRRKYGRVVNVSSAAGQLSTMGTYAPAYSISKAALNAVTRQTAAATKGSGVLVNCANPGWVRTRMGGSGAPRSVEQGAETIVWLATLPASGPTGGFFSDRRQIDW
ncbi:MAG TPA: SDR family oxidoreductase [Vicinamibacterales bacterium]|nr:SDR family oxidoreductase [Vicinamibacterales bacterium]